MSPKLSFYILVIYYIHHFDVFWYNCAWIMQSRDHGRLQWLLANQQYMKVISGWKKGMLQQCFKPHIYNSRVSSAYTRASETICKLVNLPKHRRGNVGAMHAPTHLPCDKRSQTKQAGLISTFCINNIFSIFTNKIFTIINIVSTYQLE